VCVVFYTAANRRQIIILMHDESTSLACSVHCSWSRWCYHNLILLTHALHTTSCDCFVSFPTWYTFILLFTFTIFLYMFRTGWPIIRRIKLHHSAPMATHEITTNEGKVPDAAHVIWFSWWWTSRSETCREKLYKCKKKNKSASSWKRNKVFINDARSTKHKKFMWLVSSLEYCNFLLGCGLDVRDNGSVSCRATYFA